MSSDGLTLDDLPQPEYEGPVAVEDLATDGDNPNQMTEEQFELLADRLEENGWLGGPIITDVDGTIVDGEHRWLAAKEVGLVEVPVKQYDIPDARRRLWRQELNKIEGEHDRERDAEEFDRLLSEGYSEPVEELLDTTDEDLEGLLDELAEEDPIDAPESGDADPEGRPDRSPGADGATPVPPRGDGKTDPEELWSESGTAADENTDLTAEHTVKVHFESDADLAAFEELLGRKIPEYPKSIWYPQQEELDASDKYALPSND